MLDESSWDEYHRVRGSYMSICRLASSDRVRFAQSIFFSFSLACIHGLRILFSFFNCFLHLMYFMAQFTFGKRLGGRKGFVVGENIRVESGWLGYSG